MTINNEILLTGATGFIGQALAAHLLEQGQRLVVLGRQPETQFRQHSKWPCRYVQWANPQSQPLPKEALTTVSAVIHLMGEPIAAKRWSATQKARLQDSRILTTRNLVQAIRQHRPELKTLITASAIGVYGDRGDELLDESSPPGQGFLAELCQFWEQEAQQLGSSTRSAHVRIGLVLARHGGALAQMLPLFRLGLGGRLGSGNQWMSWIHLTDLINIFCEVLNNSILNGPINAVAPQPVTNQEFTQQLATALHTRANLPVPQFALKLALGELSELVLASQRVLPQRILNTGYTFQYTSLDQALMAEFTRLN